MLKEIKRWFCSPKNVQISKSIKYVKDTSLKSWLIQIFFILIALVYFLNFYFNKGIFESDEIFNILRVKEIGLALIHGQWSQFNIYTGNPIGLATNTCYPYLLLIPFALLSTIMSATHLMGIFSSLIILIGLETCYFCFRGIQRDTRLASFLVAVCFWFSTTTSAITLFNAFDIGQEVAMIFVPVVFIGWLKWINDNKWIMLTIGMIGILYSNEPTLIIMGIVLGILSILQIKNINKSKIQSILKAVISFFICGAFYTLPILVLQITNKIDYPNSVNIRTDTPDSLIPKTFIDIISPFNYDLYDVLGIITLILLIIYWKHISIFIKQLGIIALLLTLINVHGISHFLLAHTWLDIIQTCVRFAVINNFLLCIVLVNILNYIFKHTTRQDLWQGVIYLVLLVHAFWLLFIPMKMNMTNYSGKNMNKKLYITTLNHTFNSSRYAQNRYKRIVTNLNHTTNHIAVTPLMYPDYAPSQIFKTHNEKFQGLTNIFNKNGFIIKNVKQNTWRKVPLVQYHQQKYIIKDNNKNAKAQYDKHFTKIQLHKGNNKIIVSTPVMWYRYIGLIISLIGVIYLGISIKKDKND